MFVGRGRELSRVSEILSKKEPAKFLHICGPGGIGKSNLLREIARMCNDFGYICPRIIDLSRTDYRDSSRLLTEISARLGVGYFETFTALALEYVSLQNEKRKALVRQLRESFLREYKSASSERRVVLILDTLDAVRNTEIEQTLLPMLAESTGNCSLLIVAGRERLDLTRWSLEIGTWVCLTLSGFTLGETQMLAKAKFEQKGAARLTENSVRRIHHLADRKPLIIDLTFDAILETGNEEDILRDAGEEFERKIVIWIRDLPELERRAILQATVLDRRFNAEVMADLNDMEVASCLEILEGLRRFSFVRIAEPGADFSLHDEVRFLVGKYMDVQSWFKERLYSRAVAYYDNKLEPSLSSREAQLARLERMHYQFLLDLQTGFQYWEQVFEEALELYDIDYCRALLYLDFGQTVVDLNIYN